MAETLNKKVLAETLAGKYDLTKKAAADIVDFVFDTMIESLVKEDGIDIAGFGKFTVKVRESRMGINPRTKEKIEIAASKVPAFKAAKALKTALK